VCEYEKFHVNPTAPRGRIGEDEEEDLEANEEANEEWVVTAKQEVNDDIQEEERRSSARIKVSAGILSCHI
jgi:hypothetical protein